MTRIRDKKVQVLNGFGANGHRILNALIFVIALGMFPATALAAGSLPETVTLPAGSFDYRASGEYLEDGFPVDAPMERVAFSKPFEMMRYQVTVGEYDTCVQDGVCEERLGHGKHSPHLPVTGVSYRNANAYAMWLSKQTGFKWRLPTDKEWAYAAGSRFIDDAVSVEKDVNNPATRWLAKYKKYSDLETGSDPVVKQPGFYGANKHGIYDMSGNIWEWTETCYTRTRLNEAGEIQNKTDNCGVRISAGQHRAYITFFIQDAKGGGCAVGAPPDHLGFRLLKGKKINWWSRVADVFGI